MDRSEAGPARRLHCWDARRAPRRGDEEADAEQPPLDDDQMVNALRELDEARQQVADATEPDAARGGRIKVFGGGWLMQHRGRAFDAVQGLARSPEAIDFCQRRGVQRSMRFAAAEFGLSLAHILARAYVSRMEYGYGLCTRACWRLAAL